MAGCGNHGCFIENPEGQGTNGRCNCLRPLGKENEQIIKRKLHQLEFYRRRVEEGMAELRRWETTPSPSDLANKPGRAMREIRAIRCD